MTQMMSQSVEVNTRLAEMLRFDSSIAPARVVTVQRHKEILATQQRDFIKLKV